MSLSFLMCSERSGSNLITKIMNGHTNICGPSTKHLINPIARNLFRYGDLTNENNWDALLTDIDRLFNVAFSVWKSSVDFNTLKRLAPTGDVRSLLDNIFLEEARAHGKQHVFIKENHTHEFFPFLQHQFPEARYIYLVRDPRDMALSWKDNKDHPGGVVAASSQWRNDQVQNLKHLHILNECNRAYQLTYEDLISEPQLQCEAICSTLGVPFEEDMLDFYRDDLTQKNADQTEAWRNLSKPILSDNAKKYRAKLSKEEIKAIESICFYEMSYFGYQRDIVTEESQILSQESLETRYSEELKCYPRNPAPGVKANMEAKKRFYRR